VRPHPHVRAALALAAAGTLSVTTIVAARAPASAPAQAPTPGFAIQVHDPTLRHGDPLQVTGRADAAGRQLALEFRAAGADWRPVATGVSGPDGSFGFRVRADRSGEVRVTTAPEASATRAAGSPPPPTASSPQRRIAVAAALTARARSLDVAAGRTVTVIGAVRPGVAGRTVRLVRRGRGGATLTRARTDGRGRVRLVYRTRAAGSIPVKVVFLGDRSNGRAEQRLGTMTAYRRGLASWYGLGGATACGFHARYGVAHKTLPCGTKVTVRYRGRSVVATVHDRGPFVGGREWDLNGAVASRLGFDGVAYVWTSR
jgi:rare lipoprotein A